MHNTRTLKEVKSSAIIHFNVYICAFPTVTVHVKMSSMKKVYWRPSHSLPTVCGLVFDIIVITGHLSAEIARNRERERKM